MIIYAQEKRDVLSIKAYFSHHETPVEKGKMNQRGNHKENVKHLEVSIIMKTQHIKMCGIYLKQCTERVFTAFNTVEKMKH